MNLTKERWIQVLEIGNILLGLGLLVRWYLSSGPSMHTLFTESDTIENLHTPGAVQQRIENLGPAITVEDIIRELHAHPEHLQSERSKKLFKEMQQTQKALLDNEESLQQVELELNRVALDIFNSLSTTEQTRIRSRRNTDSVEGVEAQYWKEVLKQAEDTP